MNLVLIYSNTTIVSINPGAQAVLNAVIRNSNTTIVSINPVKIESANIKDKFKYNYCFY